MIPRISLTLLGISSRSFLALATPVTTPLLFLPIKSVPPCAFAKPQIHLIYSSRQDAFHSMFRFSFIIIPNPDKLKGQRFLLCFAPQPNPQLTIYPKSRHADILYAFRFWRGEPMVSGKDRGQKSGGVNKGAKIENYDWEWNNQGNCWRGVSISNHVKRLLL